MVDDSKYVIVPNETHFHISGKDDGEPKNITNDAGRFVAKLVSEGYRILSKMSSREAIHYVLVKFSGDHTKRGKRLEPISEKDKPVTRGLDPLPLDDIPF